MKKLFENNNLLILLTVAAFIILFFWNGCNQKRKGYKDAQDEAAAKELAEKTKNDEAEAKKDKERTLFLTDSISKYENEKYNKLLSLHQYQQSKATKQIKQYEALIKTLTDSTKLSKIDSLERNGKTDSLLIGYHNLPIVTAQYDTCKSDNDILKKEIKDREMLIKSQIQYSDVLEKEADDYKKTAEQLSNERKESIKKQNKWIAFFVAINIMKDVAFVKIFSSSLK